VPACQKTNEWNLSQLEALIGLKIRNVSQMQFILMTIFAITGNFLILAFAPPNENDKWVRT